MSPPTSGVRLREGFRLERLSKSHPRREFRSGQTRVDDWLSSSALQSQQKRLSATTVLLAETGDIAGYYSLATGQIDFGDLPQEVAKKLPRRMLPVAMLAWLGVANHHQGRGLGRTLLARALLDCLEAGRTFSFIAVILDSIDETSRAFYEHYDFARLPGHPYRMYLSAERLEKMFRPA